MRRMGFLMISLVSGLAAAALVYGQGVVGQQDPEVGSPIFGGARTVVPAPGQTVRNTAGVPAVTFGPQHQFQNAMGSLHVANGLTYADSKAIKEYRESKTDDEKSAAKESIRKELEEQYDKFMETRAEEIQQLEDRVAKLREQLQRRREAKSRLVELRLEVMINRLDGLGWPDPQAHIYSPMPGLGGGAGPADLFYVAPFDVHPMQPALPGGQVHEAPLMTTPPAVAVPSGQSPERQVPRRTPRPGGGGAR